MNLKRVRKFSLRLRLISAHLFRAGRFGSAHALQMKSAVNLVDFIKISDERFGIAIADIAGKGLQAALLTTKLQATIRAFLVVTDHSVTK